MRLAQLVRNHPLPAIALLFVFAVVSLIGIRAFTPNSSDAQVAVVDAEDQILPVLNDDGRYTVWEQADFVPESELPTTLMVPAVAPNPEPHADAWSKLSTLNLASATTELDESSFEMPQPAGFNSSMNPFERSKLVAGRSVENATFGPRQPVIRVGVGGGMGGGDCK